MTTALANRVMLGLLPSDWETRMTSTRRIYFVDHITRTTMWDDPRLPVNGRGRRLRAAILSAEDCLLPELPPIANAKCDVCVHRRWVFEDSFVATMRLQPGDLRKRLKGKFEGEDAVDYGGVSREWFFHLSHEMSNRPTACSSTLRTTTTYYRSTGPRARSTSTTSSSSTAFSVSPYSTIGSSMHTLYWVPIRWSSTKGEPEGP